MKIYYCDYGERKNIPFSKALEMDLENAVISFTEVSGYKENFWGINITDEQCIQFVYLASDRWLVDIPVNEKGGTFTRQCSVNECIAMITEAYTRLKLPNLSDYNFTPFPHLKK